MTNLSRPELIPQAGYTEGLPPAPARSSSWAPAASSATRTCRRTRKAGFEVVSLYTWAPHRARAEELADGYGIAAVHTDLARGRGRGTSRRRVTTSR